MVARGEIGYLTASLADGVFSGQGQDTRQPRIIPRCHLRHHILHRPGTDLHGDVIKRVRILDSTSGSKYYQK